MDNTGTEDTGMDTGMEDTGTEDIELEDIWLAPIATGLDDEVEKAIDSHADPRHIFALVNEFHYESRPVLPTDSVCKSAPVHLTHPSISTEPDTNCRYKPSLEDRLLLRAVDADHTSLVERILFGAHVTPRMFRMYVSFLMENPFHLACYRGNKVVVDCFLPYHPDLSICGGMPLKHMYREQSALKMLLRHDDLSLMENWWPEIDRQDEQQLLPAHVAIEVGALNCFLHILENYPSWLDRRDEDDFPAFVHAVRRGPSFYEMLLDRNDTSLSYGEDGETALHALFKHRCQSAISYEVCLPLHAPTTAAVLIDNGCDVNACSGHGRFPAITYLRPHIMSMEPVSYRLHVNELSPDLRTGFPSLEDL